MPDAKRLLLISLLLALGVFPGQAQRRPPTVEELGKINAYIESHPSDFEALKERGFAFVALGYEDLFRADFAKAFLISPKNWSLSWSFGWGCLDFGHYDEALEAWNNALKWEHRYAPDNTDPWWQYHAFALAYWGLGQKKKAFAYWDQRVRSDARFGRRESLDKYTSFWTARERALVFPLFDAWKKERGI